MIAPTGVWPVFFILYVMGSMFTLFLSSSIYQYERGKLVYRMPSYWGILLCLTFLPAAIFCGVVIHIADWVHRLQESKYRVTFLRK